MKNEIQKQDTKNVDNDNNKTTVYFTKEQTKDFTEEQLNNIKKEYNVIIQEKKKTSKTLKTSNKCLIQNKDNSFTLILENENFQENEIVLKIDNMSFSVKNEFLKKIHNTEMKNERNFFVHLLNKSTERENNKLLRLRDKVTYDVNSFTKRLFKSFSLTKTVETKTLQDSKNIVVLSNFKLLNENSSNKMKRLYNYFFNYTNMKFLHSQEFVQFLFDISNLFELETNFSFYYELNDVIDSYNCFLSHLSEIFNISDKEKEKLLKLLNLEILNFDVVKNSESEKRSLKYFKFVSLFRKNKFIEIQTREKLTSQCSDLYKIQFNEYNDIYDYSKFKSEFDN